MGKRLFRIFKKDIPSRISALQGKELNLVLENNKTYHGIIVSISKEELIMEDFRNEKHNIPVKNISEIIYDQEAAF